MVQIKKIYIGWLFKLVSTILQNPDQSKPKVDLFIHFSFSLSIYNIFYLSYGCFIAISMCIYIANICTYVCTSNQVLIYIFKYLEKEKVKIIYHGTTFFIWIKVRLNYSQIYFRMFWNMYLIKEYGKQLIIDKSIFGRY